MRGINKAIVLGTCGNVETKYTANGLAITNASVATEESWKDKTSGQPQKKTQWHKIVMFGKLAEIAEKFLNKGSQVYFEGSIETRSYEKDNHTNYITEIKAHTMELVGGKKDPSDQPRDYPDGNAKKEPADDFYDAEIPF